MPTGLMPLRELAAESLCFRPTPLAYPGSSQVDFLLDVQEVEPEVLHGDNRIYRGRSLIIHDLNNSLPDELLDCFVRRGAAGCQSCTVRERRTRGNEAASVAGDDDSVGNTGVHTDRRAGLERCGGRFATGVALAGAMDKHPRPYRPMP